jgi:hypothetical protein
LIVLIFTGRKQIYICFHLQVEVRGNSFHLQGKVRANCFHLQGKVRRNCFHLQGKVRARSTTSFFCSTLGGLKVDIETDFLNIFLAKWLILGCSLTQ